MTLCEYRIDMSRPSHVRGEMYTKVLDSLPTRESFTIKGGEQELRESVFGFNLVYDKAMIKTPRRKTREDAIQPLSDGTFAARITKHEIIRILQQSVVTG